MIAILALIASSRRNKAHCKGRKLVKDQEVFVEARETNESFHELVEARWNCHARQARLVGAVGGRGVDALRQMFVLIMFMTISYHNEIQTTYTMFNTPCVRYLSKWLNVILKL